MPARVQSLNSDILVWARKRAGHSIEEVASRMNKSTEDVAAWERGLETPTYVQLEKLAYQIYKRPIALFFFPAPPEEPDAGESFRTLPNTELENLEPDTLFKIRKARGLQESLKEMNDGRNPSARRIFDEIRLDSGHRIEEVAQKARDYLGVTLETQKMWRDSTEALRSWRAAIEDSGVFVFKDSLKQKEVSGFCLVDTEFPVIYVNNSTPPNRQIFTLFHELAHVLTSTNGITKTDDSYISLLGGRNRKIEIFCNAFAAELLVPITDFKMSSQSKSTEDQDIAELALTYSVSREVVLRRFLELDRINNAQYKARISRWSSEYEHRKGSTSSRSGGNYYATQAAYLGKKYLELAFSKYYQGKCTRSQLASYLNVKTRNISGLEDFALR